MKRNVGKMDRLFRGLGALALLACAWAAPLPLAARLAAFVVGGAMMSALMSNTATAALLIPLASVLYPSPSATVPCSNARLSALRVWAPVWRCLTPASRA